MKNKQIVKWSLIGVVIAVLGYVFIYFCFCGKGWIPAGIGLGKGDWLSFLGAYLSFFGTVAVSIIAVMQTSIYRKEEEERRKKERYESIQPIFVVSIEGTNVSIPGTAEAFNPYDASTFPKHNNVSIAIENMGEYPVMHVCVFEKYAKEVIAAKEKIKMICAYSDSDDARRWGSKNKVVVLEESEHERNEDNIPKEINVCFDDIDGNSSYHTFELRKFDERVYYALKVKEVTNLR